MKSKNKPAISVIMSAYNSEKYIAMAIESVLKQNFKDFEFIIINDASIDKTAKIINRYAKKDKRIKVINNAYNQGLAKSLNLGLNLAIGRYIARMDADDISLPKRFETEYNYLQKNQNVFLIGGAAIIINEYGKKIGVFKPITSKYWLKILLRINNKIYHPTIMFRNEKIFYRKDFVYSQDYDLYLRLLLLNKTLVNIPDKLIKYRVHSRSSSKSKSAEQKRYKRRAQAYFWKSKIFSFNQ